MDADQGGRDSPALVEDDHLCRPSVPSKMLSGVDSYLGLLPHWFSPLDPPSSHLHFYGQAVPDVTAVTRTHVALVDCSRSRGSHLSQAIVRGAPPAGPPEPRPYRSRRCGCRRSLLQVLQRGHYCAHQIWKVGGGGSRWQKSRGLTRMAR